MLTRYFMTIFLPTLLKGRISFTFFHASGLKCSKVVLDVITGTDGEKKITYYMSSMNHASFPQGISWGITVIILEVKKIIITNYPFREKVTTKNRQHFCLLIKLIKEYIYLLFLGWTFPKATILVHY